MKYFFSNEQRLQKRDCKELMTCFFFIPDDKLFFPPFFYPLKSLKLKAMLCLQVAMSVQHMPAELYIRPTPVKVILGCGRGTFGLTHFHSSHI